jgi:hypothetical protein
MKTFQKLLRAVRTAQDSLVRHREVSRKAISDSYHALEGLWGEDYSAACFAREAERDRLWDEGDRLQRAYMEARNAFVEALDSAPRGAYGSAFVQEHRLHICGPTRKVLSFNREPVATLSADGDLALVGDYGWAVPTKAETRAATRAAARSYTLAMDKAVEAVLRGEVLPYYPGQKGGTLGGVSARGLAKRLGVEAPEIRQGAPWGISPWATGLRLAHEASEAFTRAACALEREPWAPEDRRAHAAERAKRNSPATLPRVDRKRFREARHLPTWRWLVTAAA